MKTTTKFALIAGASLVLAALPVAGVFAANDSQNAQINVTVGEVISIATVNNVNISATPGIEATGSHSVAVSTNNLDGYTLKLGSSSTTTDLVKGSDVITASTGSFASKAALVDNSWGYNTDAGATYAGIKANSSAETIKTTAAPASSDSTTVTWGVKVDAGLPSGTYSQTVTYTAVTN